jgi:Acetyltransferase (GNAT) domain
MGSSIYAIAAATGSEHSLTLHRVPADEIDFQLLDSFSDRVFSQRPPWLDFIRSFTDGEIVIARIEQNGLAIGYFTGLLFRRYGVPILGSPFPGWTTPFMGFNLIPGFPRACLLKPLERWAFRELGCLHLEIRDRYLFAEDADGLNFRQTTFRGYLSDLAASEDRILSGMASCRRRAIRKAEKNGLTVEVASADGFAEEYYEQVSDVFAGQGLTPTYSLERVRKLIDHVHPSGDLLLARVREGGGKTIAAGIYAGFGRLSYYWGSGSLGKYQFMRPNELLHWFALRYWKSKGAQEHEWGAAGSYKEKYGPSPLDVPSFRKSRYSAIEFARSAAERAYYMPRELKRKLYQSEVLSRIATKISSYFVGTEALLGLL